MPALEPQVALALATPTPVPAGTLATLRAGDLASAPVRRPVARWRGWAGGGAVALGLAAVLLARRTLTPTGVVLPAPAAPGETPAR